MRARDEVKLDVGCGDRKMDGSIGIDIKHGSCDILGDALNLPIRDRVCDKIECYEVLEHLSSPSKALAEYGRVLKNRGLLVASIPNVMRIRSYLRWTFKGVITVLDEHISGWRLCELKNLLTRNNFELIRTDFFTFEYQRGGQIERFIAVLCPRIGERNLRIIARAEDIRALTGTISI